MHRLNKAKDARRRAYRTAQRAKLHSGAVATNTRFEHDKRRKPIKHRKPIANDID